MRDNLPEKMPRNERIAVNEAENYVLRLYYHGGEYGAALIYEPLDNPEWPVNEQRRTVKEGYGDSFGRILKGSAFCRKVEEIFGANVLADMMARVRSSVGSGKEQG